MNKQIKLIIWDCDGVLVDSERLSSKAFAKIIRDFGVHVSDDEVYYALKGGSITNSVEYVKNLVSIPDDWNIESNYRKLSFEYFKNELKQVSGVDKILNELKIPVCIASNGPKIKIHHNLEITGLDKYFSQNSIFSGHDIQSFKPSPGLFLHAAKNMGAEPQECVVIEDSEHGAEAAKLAGMKCYGYCAETNEDSFNKHDAIPFYQMSSLYKILLN